MFVSIGFIIFLLLLPSIAIPVAFVILAFNFPVAAGVIFAVWLLLR
jgi:hypothetical protein